MPDTDEQFNAHSFSPQFLPLEVWITIKQEIDKLREDEDRVTDLEINPWKKDFLQNCGELALLPINGNKQPVDLATGKLMLEWQKHSASIEQLERPSWCLKALGYRPGPDSGHIVAVDLDGTSAITWFAERGAEVKDAGWVTRRDGAKDRLKVHFRLPEALRALLPVGKLKLHLKAKTNDCKGEQIELFNGSGQCVIAGRHPDGGEYRNEGDPSTVTEPNEAWTQALLQLFKQRQEEGSAIGQRSSVPEGDFDRISSSADNPCWVCGRDKDEDCSMWENTKTGAIGVNCHHGKTFTPLDLLTVNSGRFIKEILVSPGTVVQGHDGRRWAYAGESSGCFGPFSKFKLDEPIEAGNEKRKKRMKKRDKKSSQSLVNVTKTELEGGRFTILGWDGSERSGIAYRACSTGHIAVCACKNSVDLLRLAPLEHWVDLFGEDVEQDADDKAVGAPVRRVGRPDWPQAISTVIEAADAAGVFDREMLRGAGVWRDGGHTVWHLGDHLEVDGEERQLHEFQGEHHYARLQRLPIDPAIEPLSDAEGAAVRAVIHRIGFEGAMDALHLSGWVVLANVCGALKKRPGAQLTGATAGGKTTVAKDVIVPLTGGLCLYSSNSSEAGVRQGLGCSSRAAVIDESEQENERKREAQLRLVRLSYDGVQSLMGTPSGQERSFALRASICLIGINSTIPNAADRNRIVTITRVPLPLEQWQPVEREIAELITSETGARLIRRTVSNLDTLLHNIEVFVRVVTRRYGGRAGDTYGALLAGAHHLGSLEQLDEAGAEGWVQAVGWELESERVAEASATNEAERCLELLLRHKIAFSHSASEFGGFVEIWQDDSESINDDGELIPDGRGLVTVRELIQAIRRWEKKRDTSKKESLKEAKTCLGRLGLKVSKERGLVIHTGSKGCMTDVYAGTRWSGGAFKDRFLDLPGAQKLDSNERFRVIGSEKAMAIPMSVVLGSDATESIPAG